MSVVLVFKWILNYDDDVDDDDDDIIHCNMTKVVIKILQVSAVITYT